MDQEHQYQAFISYAHDDEVTAKRIHNALETYPIPKDMDAAVRQKLTPIFRDVTELTAHHSLSEKIREAVKTSRYLIVLCSPAAKTSHWVNEEIKLFRRLHGDRAILSVIVDGTPETAFPPALTEDGREPLAANMTTSEGFRFGITQLAASMLCVGLDRLVQRDTKRRRKRMQFLTAGALLFSGLMGGLTWTAIDARDEAEISRTEAEKMVEFMLTDLKNELQPLGKLGILDTVGLGVSEYYQAIPDNQMDDDRLARRARAQHLLGQVAIDQGQLETAKSELKAAYNATEGIMGRNPRNTNAIYAHAQSAYWVGELARTKQDFSTALIYWLEYEQLGQRLYQTDPKNVDWIMEAAFGRHNLGLVSSYLDRSADAIEYFDAAIELFNEVRKEEPQNNIVGIDIANALAGKAAELSQIKRYEDALIARDKEASILKDLQQSGDAILQERLILAELNYWKVKNSIQETCNLEKPLGLLDAYLSLHEIDPTNFTWKTNYLAYWYEFISVCEKDMSPDKINIHLEDLVKFANSYHLQENQPVRSIDSIRSDP